MSDMTVGDVSGRYDETAVRINWAGAIKVAAYVAAFAFSGGCWGDRVVSQVDGGIGY